MVDRFRLTYEDLVDVWALNDLSNKAGNIRCNQRCFMTALSVALSSDFFGSGAIRSC